VKDTPILQVGDEDVQQELVYFTIARVVASVQSRHYLLAIGYTNAGRTSIKGFCKSTPTIVCRGQATHVDLLAKVKRDGNKQGMMDRYA
jgi:hypothetical protein